MLVKKVNPEWAPSENPGLAVGDVIEITDPMNLILEGKVEAIGADGLPISSYELYGVLNDSDKENFEEWLAVKKQKQLQEKLAKEQEDLEEELKNTPIPTPVTPAEDEKAKELRLKRAEALRKAREAKKAKEVKDVK